MGAALGFALIAPAPVALAIFIALGCGLALPIVLATTVPGIARLLPRPGMWMEVLKQVLAFPLYGTVAWLVWVLIQEVEPGSAFLALLGLVIVNRLCGMDLRPHPVWRDDGTPPRRRPRRDRNPGLSDPGGNAGARRHAPSGGGGRGG